MSDSQHNNGNTISVDYAEVNQDGQIAQAAVLTPGLEGQLAIVYFETIKRLAGQLPSVPFDKIRTDLRNKLSFCNNLTEMLDIIGDELKFHKSVNLINFYSKVVDTPSLPDTSKEAGDPDYRVK